MSNTFITPGVWTAISTESSGTFSLTAGGQHCIYDGVPPDSLVGHRYTGKPVDFITGATESVYVKASRECFAVGDVEGVEPPPPVVEGDNIVQFTNPPGITGTWYFGDGNSSTAVDPVHEYAVHGTYNATFDSDTGTDDLIIDVIVTALPLPTASFTATARDPDTNIYDFVGLGGDTYKWVIDDTEYIGQNVTHIFNPTPVLGDTYLSELVTTDINANTDYSSQSLFVLQPNILPVGDFSYLKNELVVSFDSTVDDPDGNNSNIVYLWDFGDGNSSTDRDPIHAYDPPAIPEDPSGQTFTVTMTATDERGGELIVQHTLTVYDYQKLGPNLIVNGDFETDDASTFDASSSTIELVGGVMTITSTSGSSGRMSTDVTGMNVGAQYKLSLDYNVEVNSNQTVKNLVGFATEVSVSLNSLVPVTEVIFLTADEVNGAIKVYAGVVGNTVILTRIALEEVL